MHAGRQDVALLKRVWDTDVTNVFDTQIAAGFAGLRAQLGYEALLGEVLGVRLSKSASFTKWDARPLSPEQVEYARGDVLHLLALASALQARVDELGRLEWAREECRMLEAITDVRDVDSVFEPPAAHQLAGPGPARGGPRARGLARAHRARGRSSVQTILTDAGLVEIAKRRPKTMERMRQIRGINESTLHRRGKAVLEVVERGREREPIPVEGDRPAQPHPEDAVLIALGEALVRAAHSNRSSPTSSSPRRPTCSASRSPCATTALNPSSGRSKGGAGSSSARSSSSCCAAPDARHRLGPASAGHRRACCRRHLLGSAP